MAQRKRTWLITRGSKDRNLFLLLPPLTSLVIAQLVEHSAVVRRVTGSIPVRETCFFIIRVLLLKYL